MLAMELSIVIKVYRDFRWRSDESRSTACYIFDDITRPNMAYTAYSLLILSHIVLAKFAITSREIF
jgi:hypothetical protein